jgi:hypothetical protein
MDLLVGETVHSAMGMLDDGNLLGTHHLLRDDNTSESILSGAAGLEDNMC